MKAVCHDVARENVGDELADRYVPNIESDGRGATGRPQDLNRSVAGSGRLRCAGLRRDNLRRLRHVESIPHLDPVKLWRSTQLSEHLQDRSA